MVGDGYPHFGAAGKRGNSGHIRRQSILGTEVDVLRRPRVVASNKSSGLSGNIRGLKQQCTARGGGRRILLLGGIEVDRLWIRLRGRSGAIGDINANVERSHDVHPDQARRRLEPNNHNETRSPACFAPLQVQVLGLPRNLKWFLVSAVYEPLERL